MNIPEDQTRWFDNWLAGLRDGSLTAAAGFIRRLASVGVDEAERAMLIDLYVLHGAPALCDALEAMRDGRPLVDWLAEHYPTAPPGDGHDSPDPVV